MAPSSALANSESVARDLRAKWFQMKVECSEAPLFVLKYRLVG